MNVLEQYCAFASLFAYPLWNFTIYYTSNSVGNSSFLLFDCRRLICSLSNFQKIEEQQTSVEEGKGPRTIKRCPLPKPPFRNLIILDSFKVDPVCKMT